MRTIFAEYNPQRNSIDVYTSASYMLTGERAQAISLELSVTFFKRASSTCISGLIP